jgi:hypothetical protein
MLTIGACGSQGSSLRATADVQRLSEKVTVPGGWVLDPPPDGVDPKITAEQAIEAAGHHGEAVFALLTDLTVRDNATAEVPGSGDVVFDHMPVWVVSYEGEVCSSTGHCDPDAMTYVAVDPANATVLTTLYVGSRASP